MFAGLTEEISKFLDRDMDIALRKASFLARDANYTENDIIHFVRTQMKRSYADIHAGNFERLKE